MKNKMIGVCATLTGIAIALGGIYITGNRPIPESMPVGWELSDDAAQSVRRGASLESVQRAMGWEGTELITDDGQRMFLWINPDNDDSGSVTVYVDENGMVVEFFVLR